MQAERLLTSAKTFDFRPKLATTASRRDGLAAGLAGIVHLAVLAVPMVGFGRPDATGWVCLGMFFSAIAVFYGVEVSASRRQTAVAAPAQRADQPALRAAFWGSLLVFATLAVAVFERAGQLGNRIGLAEGLGLFLMLTGCTLRWLAVRALHGRFRTETTVTANYRLQTGGIYAWLRHPSETGLFLLMIGAATSLSSPWAGTLAVLQLPLIAWRVRIETCSFEEALGPEFSQYQQRVAAFVPLVF